MDPVNIIIGLNIIATFGANLSGAQKGFKSSLSESVHKPNTYLQKLPLVLSTITLVALILAVFQIGTLDYSSKYNSVRIAGLIIYLLFSWIQIWSFKTLGNNYSQEIMIRKNHQLISTGPFRLIRHPQYLSQILLDLGAAAATLSYLVFPFLILRAKEEEKLLSRHFKDEFSAYKKRSGFLIPFIG